MKLKFYCCCNLQHNDIGKKNNWAVPARNLPIQGWFIKYFVFLKGLQTGVFPGICMPQATVSSPIHLESPQGSKSKVFDMLNPSR